jgi:geranylgeranyl diphosphate synthase, type I
MSLPVILDKYRSEVNAELKTVLADHSLVLYDMMRYHLGWIDSQGKPTQNNAGKALRPSLCLFSCEAVGGKYQPALPAAAALELVHNFSLIHDDIQDNDRERRHRPTVWAIWGQPQAINAGNAMRNLASIALLRLRQNGIPADKQMHVGQRLDDVSLRLIEGQYLDISFEDRFDITTADYLKMINGKTGALISGSMEIGAYLGTSNVKYIQEFKEIGRNLGLAFQIRDDILGIWGKEEEVGKPAGSDIRRHKKSFPVVFALEHAPEFARKELVSIYRNNNMEERLVKRVLDIFNSVNTCQEAQKLVEQYSADSWEAFKKLQLPEQIESDMEDMVQFLTARNY